MEPGTQRPLPPRLYYVTDLARHFRVSSQTIRDYTRMGLVPAQRMGGRDEFRYQEDAFVIVEKILELRRQNRPLKEIIDCLAS